MLFELPIGTHVLRHPSGLEAVKPDEGAFKYRGLTSQDSSVDKRMYLDWSKIWGPLNGDYYKFALIIGGRGIGKSYGVWEYILRQFKDNKWDKFNRFMWLRTTDDAVQALTANTGQKMCPYPFMQDQYGVKVYTVGSNIYIREVPKDYELMKEDEWNEWKKEHPGVHVGYVQGVSTFYKQKGLQFEEVNLIVYDEVNRERGERKTFDQTYAFINQIETIARTRQNVRVIMMGNTIDEASEIAGQLNFEPPYFGRFRLRGKRTIVYYIEDTDAFKKKREESLAFIFSDKGRELPSLGNKVDADELFKPRVAYISRFVGATFMYRAYFTRTNYFDVYSIPTGIWIGVTKNKAVNPIFSLNPDLDGVVRYNKEIVNNLKEQYLNKHITYQSVPLAHKFKAALQVVITLK